jgi:hypothetical protein
MVPMPKISSVGEIASRNDPFGRKRANAGVLEPSPLRRIVPRMKMGGAICTKCRAGFRRVELESERGTESEYHCPLCGNLVEKLDGNRLIAYRLTSIPPKYLDSFRTPDSCSA